ncbi:MAG TPA: asparaginase [Burkholderiaceae bacterium]|nr:asparaginase [Burkholderiaceae bacterium]
MNPILVEAWRGGSIESQHRGAFAVVDARGQVVASLGDIGRPVFPRSAVKVLQALPLVASGAAERFGLDDAELALACASHGGEAPHVRTAASMLAKAGLDEQALECGTHWPYNEAAQRALAASAQAPGVLHNNCSGKHAGFVCLGCLMAAATGRDARAFLAGYVQPDHPVMREVGAAIEAATGWRLADGPHGTDGCSIPTYGIPLERLAHAFARVATGVGLSPEHAAAARRLRTAVARQPFMVAGSGRFDTRVMERFGERVFCKVGAEGMYCAALPQAGLGIAVKVDDGNTSRACEVVMAALLRAWVEPLDAEQSALLDALSDVALRNWRGIDVGRLSASAALCGAARPAKRPPA